MPLRSTSIFRYNGLPVFIRIHAVDLVGSIIGTLLVNVSNCEGKPAKNANFGGLVADGFSKNVVEGMLAYFCLLLTVCFGLFQILMEFLNVLMNNFVYKSILFLILWQCKRLLYRSFKLTMKFGFLSLCQSLHQIRLQCFQFPYLGINRLISDQHALRILIYRIKSLRDIIKSMYIILQMFYLGLFGDYNLFLLIFHTIVNGFELYFDIFLNNLTISIILFLHVFKFGYFLLGFRTDCIYLFIHVLLVHILTDIGRIFDLFYLV